MEPSELMGETLCGIKPGMGRGEQEARLGSDIFVAEMANSAAAGSASTDGSESDGC
jgi:hypothetical protein